MDRENYILAFSKLLHMTKLNKGFNNFFYVDTLMQHFLVVSKLALKNRILTEIALNTIENKVEEIQFIKDTQRILAITVNGCLKHKDDPNIPEVTSSILKRYFKNRKSKHTKEKDPQFIFLSEISECNSEVAKAVEKFKSYLYCTEGEIAKHLIWLAEEVSSEDILILNLRYLIEILQNPHSTEYKVLMNKDVKEKVFTKMLSIKNRLAIQGCQEDSRYHSGDKDKLLTYYAEFVGLIGIAESQINEVSWFSKPSPTPKYHDKREGTNLGDIHQEWLDDVCVTDQEYIRINRENTVVFGLCLYDKLNSLIISAERPPNWYLYSIWRLEELLLRQKGDRKNKELEAVSFQIDDNNPKLFVKQVMKFEKYNLEDYARKFPSYSEYPNFSKFIFYLVNNLRHEGFKQIFETLGSLVLTEDHIFIKLILPYLVYYSLRGTLSEAEDNENRGFSTDDELLDNTVAFLQDVLNNGTQRHINIVFEVLDFLKVCLVQDKASCKMYIIENKFSYVENLFLLNVKVDRASMEKNILHFVKVLDKKPVVKDSFIAVQRIRTLLGFFHRDELFEAAKKVRDHKRAVMYYEEYIRITKLDKPLNGPNPKIKNPPKFYQDFLEFDEIKNLVE